MICCKLLEASFLYSGLGGTRTHNQRLKRAVIYNCKYLIYRNLQNKIPIVAILLLRPFREKHPIPLEFSNRTGRPCGSCQLEQIGRSTTKDRKIAPITSLAVADARVPVRRLRGDLAKLR